MRSRPDQNCQNAMAFYDLMFNQGKPAEAVEHYVGANYTQHILTWLMARLRLSSTLTAWRASIQASM